LTEYILSQAERLAQGSRDGAVDGAAAQPTRIAMRATKSTTALHFISSLS
jgi:hypothetical protein